MNGILARVSVLATFLFTQAAAADGLPLPKVPRTEDSVVLRGVVVNSVDGTPVRSALVQLLEAKPRAVLTGGDGAFLFEGLAAGDAVLVVRKPGYFSAQEYYPESVGEQRVHLAANLPPVELKLYPEAVVYGRVTNENGRPLEGFTVQLLHAGVKRATTRRGNQPSAVTNENGEYRLAELRAGTYLVSVTQKLDAAGPLSLFQAIRLSHGYPNYFYPSVTDLSLATPVRLTPGKQVQADMRLTSQPLYRISGNVQGEGGDAPTVVVIVGRHDVRPVAANSVMPGFTNFVLEGVPAGSYLVGAMQPSQAGEKTAISEVEVVQDVDGVSLVLSEKMRIPVRFQYQATPDSGHPTQDTGDSVSFLRTDLPVDDELFAANVAAGPSSPEGEISLEPGTYRAKANVQPGRCVASVKSGGTDILNEDLVVKAGALVDPIDVVVRDDCGRIQGMVLNDGKPTMGRVLLIEEDAPQRGFSTPANSDGAFQLQGLLPGKYLAIAVDGADDLDPEDPENVAKVKSRATMVEVQPSGAANLTLELKSLEP